MSEGVIPCGNHGCDVAMQGGLGCDMKIPDNIVTAPEANETDHVRVDVTKEEGHHEENGRRCCGW